MKKESGLIFVLLLIGFVFASRFVSAAPTTSNQAVDSFMNSVVGAVSPIFQYTLGADGLDSNLFFVKILVFFLMIAVIWMAVKSVPGLAGNTILMVIITVIIGILGARFLTSSALVNFVWLPSGVVGIALASLIPFIIYFFFVNSFNTSFIRRPAWILFVLLFVGLAIARWDTLNEGDFNLAWIYLATAGLSLLSFAFDRQIHARFLISAIEQKGAELNALNVATIQTTIQNARQTIANPASTPAQVVAAQKIIKDEERKLKALLSS